MSTATRLAEALHKAGDKLEGSHGAEAILAADTELAEALELGLGLRASLVADNERLRAALTAILVEWDEWAIEAYPWPSPRFHTIKDTVIAASLALSSPVEKVVEGEH